MISVHTDRIGDVAVVACAGELQQLRDASSLRDTVRHESDSRLLVLDFSEVESVSREGLGALTALEMWAADLGIDLKLFNPRLAVRYKLEAWSRKAGFLEIVPLDRVTELVVLAQNATKERHARPVEKIAA